MTAVTAPASLYPPRQWVAGGMDLELALILVALVTAGIVMVASASVGFADSVYGDPWFFVKRHAVYLVLGCLGGLLVAAVPSGVWRDYGWVLLVVALLLLVLVLIPGLGRRVNGSQRWLMLGPITVQASEVAKFCGVIFFAGYLARRQLELRRSWRGIIKPIVLVAAIAVLLLMEPDFGSAVVLCATLVTMMFLAGVKVWQFGLLTLFGGGGLVLIALLSPYRLQRLITFLDPWADQFNSGYQLTQSLIAFGRGEWLGVGLGNSVQKLFYLPEAHTDFIFAIVAEEFGLIGCTVLIGLFVALVFKILDIAKRAILAGNAFASFAAFGIAMLIGGQTFINIGVASGLLPTKGLTLPFISYGGSSLIICCALMAFLLRLDWELRQPQPAEKKKKEGGDVRPDSEVKRVLVMAGGTGGHVFPALAVAEVLRTRGWRIDWLGTRRGIEARLVPEARIDLHYISIEGLRGKGVSTWLRAPWLLLRAVFQALAIVRRIKPDVVLGLGGFASGPGGVAARLLGTPLVIHEQNAVAGTTNKLLAVVASRVLQGFPDSLPKAVLTGNPVREDISALDAPESRYEARADRGAGGNLLVLGGSLGALAINDVVPAAVSLLALEARPTIWHQTGVKHVQQTVSRYRELEVEARIDPFIGDMAAALAWADLVISRSGALTVAELAAAGVAAVLVPFPFAIDDHQAKNADWLVRRGAAVVKRQDELDAQSLAQLLRELTGDRPRLKNMAVRARALALPEAANQVAEVCREVANG